VRGILAALVILVILAVAGASVAQPRPERVVDGGRWGQVRWTAHCTPDRACRIAINRRTVVAIPMRGTLVCRQRRHRLACLFTHTTHLHIQKLVVVDLTRRTRRVFELATMAIVESFRWRGGEIELDEVDASGSRRSRRVSGRTI
jgi:hypothetical protein